MSKVALIADDANLIRVKMREFLESEGFMVLEAENGQEALDHAKANSNINILITDLNMPAIDGMELSRQVRAMPHYAKIPIFVLSTESTPDLKVLGKQVGVTAWILKPFDPQSLRNIFKALKL